MEVLLSTLLYSVCSIVLRVNKKQTAQLAIFSETKHSFRKILQEFSHNSQPRERNFISMWKLFL